MNEAELARLSVNVKLQDHGCNNHIGRSERIMTAAAAVAVGEELRNVGGRPAGEAQEIAAPGVDDEPRVAPLIP